MVYTWGSKLNIKSEENVDENYGYQEGEYGVVKELYIQTSRAIDPNFLPSSQQIAQKVRETFQQKGCEVRYMRIKTEMKSTGGIIDHYYRIFTLEECHFKKVSGNFTGLEWVIIIGAITIAGIALGVTAVGLWVVVQVMGATEGGIATIGVGIIIIIILFGFVFLVLGGRVKAKGKRGAVEVGKT